MRRSLLRGSERCGISVAVSTVSKCMLAVSSHCSICGNIIKKQVTRLATNRFRMIRVRLWEENVLSTQDWWTWKYSKRYLSKRLTRNRVLNSKMSQLDHFELKLFRIGSINVTTKYVELVTVFYSDGLRKSGCPNFQHLESSFSMIDLVQVWTRSDQESEWPVIYVRQYL